MKQLSILITFFLLFNTKSTIAQEVINSKTVDKAYKVAVKTKSTTVLDSLLRTNIDSTLKAYVYLSKAAATTKINKKILNNDYAYNFEIKDNIKEKILALYDSSMNVAKCCATIAQIHRYEFLNEYDKKNPLYNFALKDLKVKGYKPKQISLGFSPVVAQGKNTWLGAELVLVRTLQPAYKVKDSIGTVLAKEDFSVFDGFTITYQYAPHTKAHDLAFSLMQFGYKPIHLNITKFGFQSPSISKNYWYYRPEIGFFYKRVHLYWSYNLYFKKAYRSIGEKSMLNLKYDFILQKNDKMK